MAERNEIEIIIRVFAQEMLEQMKELAKGAQK